MSEELDYYLMPEDAWEALVDTFGMAEGQEAIRRIVIKMGTFVQHNKIEVYLLPLILSKYGTKKKKKRWFSRKSTVG